MGWWVAFGVVSLILRHGLGAEALAWSLLFGLTPVFRRVLSGRRIAGCVLQPIALALPSAHVFEGMRAAMLDGTIRWDHMPGRSAFNAAWMVAAVRCSRVSSAKRACVAPC